MRIGTAQLCVTEGPNHGDQGTRNPNHQGPANIVGQRRYQRRRLENASTNDDADNQGDGAKGA
jgi:hypothetical protein